MFTGALALLIMHRKRDMPLVLLPFSVLSVLVTCVNPLRPEMVVALPSFYFPLREGDGYPGVYNPHLVPNCSEAGSLCATVSQSLLTTPDGQKYNLGAIVSFFFFQIFGGQVGIPVILLTLYFTKGVKKHPMLVNFLVTWIVYSVPFCIL